MRVEVFRYMSLGVPADVLSLSPLAPAFCLETEQIDCRQSYYSSYSLLHLLAIGCKRRSRKELLYECRISVEVEPHQFSSSFSLLFSFFLGRFCLERRRRRSRKRR